MKLIDSDSPKTTLSELDLFSLPPTQVGVINSRFVDVPLVNHLSGSGPLEWRINHQKTYLNLQRSYILFKCRITDEKGNVIPKMGTETTGGKEVPVKNPPYAFTQMLGKTLFKQFHLYLNGQMVADSGPNYAYRAFLETELMLDKETKNNSTYGYSYDSKYDNGASAGYLSRSKWSEDGKWTQFAGGIHLDMFNQPKLLLNFIDFRLVGHLNNPEFLVDQFEFENDDTKYKVQLDDVRLVVNEFELHESASLAIETKLREKGSISYPLNAVQMRSFFISSGRYDCPENKLFNGHIPKRVIVGLVASDAYNGDYSKSPFNFKNFDLTDIFLDVGGRTIPARGMKLDYANNQYMQAYTNMQEGLGFGRSGANNGISFNAFKNGWAFYVFEVSPSLEMDAFDLLQHGTTSLRMNFAKPVPTPGIHCVVHAEFDSLLTLDADRNPHVESIM